MKAKEQFHFHYGADQLILFHKTFLSQEAPSSKANFGARRVRPAAVLRRGSAMSPAGTCARTTCSHRERAVSCFRIYNVACTSAHIPHSMVLTNCAVNWGGDRDGTNARSLSGLELASLFSQQGAPTRVHFF